MESVAVVPLGVEVPPPVDSQFTVCVTFVPRTMAVKPMVAGQAFRVIERVGVLTETSVTMTLGGDSDGPLGLVGLLIVTFCLTSQPETASSTAAIARTKRKRVIAIRQHLSEMYK